MERSAVTGPSQRELGCCVPDREGQGVTVWMDWFPPTATSVQPRAQSKRDDLNISFAFISEELHSLLLSHPH